ncbi:unnamed protein product [Fusarium venenatum]|uniref:Uncharacterized protein n=1 Tax=Fusarium venenatum TaxID=56646 RepID=A0A2L2ST98_9HYPO|nr:uncharacterized protein FVRRES_04928 [Fusarium venenatum]CEI60492.1 unnamed protein product [Fusarium venenatum]
MHLVSPAPVEMSYEGGFLSNAALGSMLSLENQETKSKTLQSVLEAPFKFRIPRRLRRLFKKKKGNRGRDDVELGHISHP